MSSSETVGGIITSVIVSVIIGLIVGAIVHFFLADNIYGVLIMYIAVATGPSSVSNLPISKSSAIVATLVGVTIAFLILQFGFPMIFGPNMGFPYSMLNLGPVITGLIVSWIVGLILAVVRA